MVETIQVKLTNQVCPLGELYAQKHMTTPSKAAVVSCEGMCLRGEIARRAANLIAHRLAPEKTVRICHGGFLETSGGMKELVQHADQMLVLDGCFMVCGTRLTKGAFPTLKPNIVITDKLFEFDRDLFAVDEMSEAEIQAHAQTVANKIVAEYLN
ncbi:MAG: putative zinc-binding protein [Anaerolineales bacterium]